LAGGGGGAPGANPPASASESVKAFSENDFIIKAFQHDITKQQ